MKRIKSTKKVLAGVTLAASSLFAVNASAAIITAWDWVTDGGFVDTTDATPNAATCSNGLQADCSMAFSDGVTPSGITDTSSIITWGTGTTLGGGNGEQSGLQSVSGVSGGAAQNATLLGSGLVEIGGQLSKSDPSDQPPITASAFEQIVTNAGWTNTGATIHYNNVILSSGGAMTSTTLLTTFQLTGPVGSPLFGTDLAVAFNETPNNSGDGCPAGNPHGTNCDDVFTISGSGLTPISFVIDGQQYRAAFRLATGPGAIVSGNTIYTAELKPGTSVILIQARIDTIPLPGVPALMGLGLVLIGWRVRGRKLV